jgi:hypothetical protein
MDMYASLPVEVLTLDYRMMFLEKSRDILALALDKNSILHMNGHVQVRKSGSVLVQTASYCAKPL